MAEVINCSLNKGPSWSWPDRSEVIFENAGLASKAFSFQALTDDGGRSLGTLGKEVENDLPVGIKLTRPDTRR